MELATSQELHDPHPEDNYKLHRRFDRMGRLVGDAGMEKLLRSSVMVVGLGGVGSFAAESLARSGVGTLYLVDFDKVCITNTNRQLQAMKGTIGKMKGEVLAERLQKINPQATIEFIPLFFNERTGNRILESRTVDLVLDCIDNVTAKCFLIDTCVRRELPIVVSTGASGRWDPTQIKIADLNKTTIDPLARDTRKLLKKNYGFPTKKKFNIPAVYSTEPAAHPQDLAYDNGEGFRCVCPGGNNSMHSCDKRSLIYGTASFVTGSFGLTCASIAVRTLLDQFSLTPNSNTKNPKEA